jgi:hypothetical protein
MNDRESIGARGPNRSAFEMTVPLNDLPEIRRAADAGRNCADQYDIDDILHHVAEGDQDGERKC